MRRRDGAAVSRQRGWVIPIMGSAFHAERGKSPPHQSKPTSLANLQRELDGADSFHDV
jgi:hypothetical protein